MIIDIAGRFYSAFGYIPSGYPKLSEDAIAQFGVTVSDRQFADLTLRGAQTGKEYRFQNGDSLMEGMPGVLAPCPMVSFSRSKNIKTTDIDNSDFQVVESFGNKPWVINIEGILIDLDEHWYPSSKVVSFRELFNSNEMYDVIDSQIMEDLGIQSVYFTSLPTFGPVKEYQDTVKFKIAANSIQPLEFFIN